MGLPNAGNLKAAEELKQRNRKDMTTVEELGMMMCVEVASRVYVRYDDVNNGFQELELDGNRGIAAPCGRQTD